jgi:hypothetical protein
VAAALTRDAVRQERSRIIVDELEPWLHGKLQMISQKTQLAEAIRYALSRWKRLTRFIDEGQLVAARSIRPIALSGKNALFAGSDGGSEHWAIIASLIETCKLCDVDPQFYLADVIIRIVNNHPTAEATSCYPGRTKSRKTSKPWPENAAYALST